MIPHSIYKYSSSTTYHSIRNIRQGLHGADELPKNKAFNEILQKVLSEAKLPFWAVLRRANRKRNTEEALYVMAVWGLPDIAVYHALQVGVDADYLLGSYLMIYGKPYETPFFIEHAKGPQNRE